MSYLISDDYLMHHGVKGMKWGVRHDKDRGKLALAASKAVYDSNRGSDQGITQFIKQARKHNKKYQGDVVGFRPGYTKKGQLYIEVAFSEGKTLKVNEELYKSTYVKHGKKYANGKF